MRERFSELSGALEKDLRAGEVLLCNLSAERSDFVRFNRGLVRQAGSVEQAYLTLRLASERRQAQATLPFGDVDSARAALARVRDSLAGLPADPLFLINEEPRSTSTERRGTLAPAQVVVEQAVEQAKGRDMVGFYAGGTLYRGFANSLGQRNWHEVDSFNFDWSLYRQGDQAVKTSFAGSDWDAGAFAKKMARAAEEVGQLAAPRRTLEPGEYRAYLAPPAINEVMGLLCWGGFSARARHTRQSPLLLMQEGRTLSPLTTVSENVAQGIAPAFQGQGFLKPPRIELISQGRLADPLVSPRSAKEYGLATNGAGGGEAPDSLDMAPGALEEGAVLGELDRGLYISNLWYLNFSDRPAGRITGMTRFATFWVEGGRIAAPVTPMRFDDSVYRILGSELAGLTRTAEMLPDPSTYGERSTSSARLPGALLKGLRFTL
ncbi:MAG TPA: metallopeptidase TldD-related protein [Burkholderiales bacterium]|nr:metallopeptidase TldD-related protein [Burkholderiales bacterium]